MFAWRWNPAMLYPEFATVPRGYSRASVHCDGWHYMLVAMPLPPDLPKAATD